MAGARVDMVALHKSHLLGGRTISVLRGIDLHLDPGEMVAVVGASGAGKSTLLHVLGTLDRPTSGTIHFEDTDVSRFGSSELAQFRNRTIGFVFQFHHLLPDFTAVENCAMPLYIAGQNRVQANSEARALLIRVGLEHRLGHRPGELSGGEQQRVALARALVGKPRLLLADEPTGNLDLHTGEEIHQLMVDLNRENGTTMLVVTHNQALAARMPRCLSMVDGVLVDRPQPETHVA